MAKRKTSRQLSLFVGDPPSQQHSATSVAAADQIAPTAGTLRMQLFDWLQGQGIVGATDEEMQRGVPMAANTQRPRRTELVALGLVVDSGLVRRTSSGRSATVWIVKQQQTRGA